MTNLELCKQTVQQAQKAGATDAVCRVYSSQELEITVDNGKSEGSEMSRDYSLSLTVYIGKKSASGYTEDMSPEAINELVDNLIAAAGMVPEDKYAGLPDPKHYQTQLDTWAKKLNMVDSTGLPKPDDLLAMALDMEGAARQVDKVYAVRDTSVSAAHSHMAIATSNGFAGEREGTMYGGSVSAVAEENDEKVIHYEGAARRHFSDMPDVKTIGRKAGERARDMLNQTELGTTGKLPLVFEDKLASHVLLGNLLRAMGGSLVAEGKSFLDQSDLGQKLFGNLTITDNWARAKALGSRVFDGSGIAGPEELKLVENGVLNHLRVGVRSARQLGLEPNGRSSTSNVWIENGSVSKDELVKDIKLGLFVTGVMGQGFVPTTGDVSYIAEGFIIRDGKITNEYVQGATIAGNLKAMLANATCADDLVFEYASNSPTVRVDGMTVSG